MLLKLSYHVVICGISFVNCIIKKKFVTWMPGKHGLNGTPTNFIEGKTHFSILKHGNEISGRVLKSNRTPCS